MITPDEIKDQCLKSWKDVLIHTLESKDYFPKEISRIGKVTPKDILSKLAEYKASIKLLNDNSKGVKKNGYKVLIKEQQFDKIGTQPVPEKIIIEDVEDYLSVTNKEKEFKRFLNNHQLIAREIPVLLEWIKLNPLKLIEHDSWEDTLKVCHYFLTNPKPNLYVRELPIEIHTKYVLENSTIICSLLDFLIPDHVNQDERKFEKRFNLKYSEPLVRIRFLDKKLSPIETATDISITLSEFCDFNSDCLNIFVTENIMNFLTLPNLENTIALWSGGGFSVSYLKEIEWIKSKQFYYWGDIDTHGFHILNQFRGYFPNTISLMMDENTLSQFKPAIGPIAANQTLNNLTNSEKSIYNYITQNKLRLEQEKIPHFFAIESINLVFKSAIVKNQ